MLLFVSVGFSSFKNFKVNMISAKHLICLEGKGKEHKNHCSCTTIVCSSSNTYMSVLEGREEKDSSEIQI